MTDEISKTIDDALFHGKGFMTVSFDEIKHLPHDSVIRIVFDMPEFIFCGQCRSNKYYYADGVTHCNECDQVIELSKD